MTSETAAIDMKDFRSGNVAVEKTIRMVFRDHDVLKFSDGHALNLTQIGTWNHHVLSASGKQTETLLLRVVKDYNHGGVMVSGMGLNKLWILRDPKAGMDPSVWPHAAVCELCFEPTTSGFVFEAGYPTVATMNDDVRLMRFGTPVVLCDLCAPALFVQVSDLGPVYPLRALNAIEQLMYP